VSRYQKGKTNLDFTEARDGEWQWHQLGHMQVCTSRQTDNHASTPPVTFLQAGCPSCRPTNSVKALKAKALKLYAKSDVKSVNAVCNCACVYIHRKAWNGSIHELGSPGSIETCIVTCLLDCHPHNWKQQVLQATGSEFIRRNFT